VEHVLSRRHVGASMVIFLYAFKEERYTVCFVPCRWWSECCLALRFQSVFLSEIPTLPDEVLRPMGLKDSVGR
jgi:hypothetical protein